MIKKIKSIKGNRLIFRKLTRIKRARLRNYYSKELKRIINKDN